MDLATTFMGLELAHPLVPAASPLTGTLEGLRRLEDAGASAVVLESPLEEDLERRTEVFERCFLRGIDSHFEAVGYFPSPAELEVGPDEYLGLISKARESLGIPVIASLNALSAKGCADFARDIERAGAQAIELNLYFLPTDPLVRGADLEDSYVEAVREVRSRLSIPLAVKLRPSFTAPANVASRLVHEAGVNGIVLFNRFYGPDYDLENLELVPRMVLTTSDDMRLPMTWTAILYGRLGVDLALSTGIHTGRDVLKAVMAGASVAQMASELMRNGVGRLGAILQELRTWLQEQEYESLHQLKGAMSQQHLEQPEDLRRAGAARVDR